MASASNGCCVKSRPGPTFRSRRLQSLPFSGVGARGARQSSLLHSNSRAESIRPYLDCSGHQPVGAAPWWWLHYLRRRPQEGTQPALAHGYHFDLYLEFEPGHAVGEIRTPAATMLRRIVPAFGGAAGEAIAYGTPQAMTPARRSDDELIAAGLLMLRGGRRTVGPRNWRRNDTAQWRSEGRRDGYRNS
jgi:hypothetical protein